MDYDVIIVGASIAGCTAATAYGRAGLRVALLERQRNPQAHKTLCGHFVLGGTHDVLERLGLWQPMLAQGAAVTTGIGVWTESGWIVPRPGNGVPPAISLRRSKLDPLLREIAGGTPGVDLMLGHRVVDLVEDSTGAIVGVVATTDGADRTTLRARLVVGADGHHSTVARLAQVAEDHAPNERFLFWTYYEGATMNGPGDGQLWPIGQDRAVCIRVDDELTQVGIFPAKARLPEFAGDRLAAFDRYVERLPDGPSLAGARRVSNLIGTTDYPCIRRDPTPRPGLVLIGDAATASDPVPAVGCGWAFRSAAWLVDATAGPLAAAGTCAGHWPPTGVRTGSSRSTTTSVERKRSRPRPTRSSGRSPARRPSPTRTSPAGSRRSRCGQRIRRCCSTPESSREHCCASLTGKLRRLDRPGGDGPQRPSGVGPTVSSGQPSTISAAHGAHRSTMSASSVRNLPVRTMAGGARGTAPGVAVEPGERDVLLGLAVGPFWRWLRCWRARPAWWPARRRTPSAALRTPASGRRPARPATARSARRPFAVIAYVVRGRRPTAPGWPWRALRREPLRLLVDAAGGAGPEALEAALHLLGQLVGGPRLDASSPRIAYEVVVSSAVDIVLLSGVNIPPVRSIGGWPWLTDVLQGVAHLVLGARRRVERALVARHSSASSTWTAPTATAGRDHALPPGHRHRLRGAAARRQPGRAFRSGPHRFRPPRLHGRRPRRARRVAGATSSASA